jgi:hypothetical protein
VETARGKVDARRENARLADAGAAAGAIVDPTSDPDFQEWLKKQEAKLRAKRGGGGR